MSYLSPILGLKKEEPDQSWQYDHTCMVLDLAAKKMEDSMIVSIPSTGKNDYCLNSLNQNS